MGHWQNCCLNDIRHCQDPMGLSEGPNQYNYADQNGQNTSDPEGKFIIPAIFWIWRIYEIYDLHA